MKQISFLIVVLILGGVIGFLFGRSNGYEERQAEQRDKSYSELLTELRQRELLSINDFVKVTSSMKTVDEGGLFKVKNINYLTGTIENSALATAVKDIKLKVDYLSPTKSVISSEEITIYDIVSPSRAKDFKERISVPEKASEWQFSLVDLKTD
jgi:hypothetical protein